MFRVRVVGWIVLIVAMHASHADHQLGAVGNGCGSGWNTYLVPDSIPVLNCKFEDACNQHDQCYGVCENSTSGDCEYRRCKEDGDLFKDSICLTDIKFITLRVKAAQRKRQCDIDLYSQIKSLNAGKAVCESLAIVYRDAVRNFGEGAFIGITPVGGGPRQTKEQYDAAISQFFKSGTEEQFKKFVESVNAGRPVVNLQRPLMYDEQQGLINFSAEVEQ